MDKGEWEAMVSQSQTSRQVKQGRELAEILEMLKEMKEEINSLASQLNKSYLEDPDEWRLTTGTAEIREE